MTAPRTGLVLLALLSAPLFASSPPAETPLAWNAPHATNPILPGYFADPSIIEHQGHFYLYATLDPWGGDTLGCWESTDLKNWDYRHLNWPTKATCTSPTSGGSKVWAPSVVRAPDGRFHMFVSVGSEVWTGVADHPLGPWTNPLGNKPLIPGNFRPGFHMIDAEAFIDEDGSAYLYWGSGWEWKNGRCFAVKLNEHLDGFATAPRDVTPPDYFEGPFLFKHAGRYYLSWSEGRTDRDTYKVRYAIGDTPFGPFTTGANSPILKTDEAASVISPGHHAVFSYQGSNYIIYHRQSVPFIPGTILRQTCAAPLTFDKDGSLLPVVPDHVAPLPFSRSTLPNSGLRGGDSVECPRQSPVVTPSPRPGRADTVQLKPTASSCLAPYTAPSSVLDDNYATRWSPASDDQAPWLALDLGSVREVSNQELRFEYPWKHYDWLLEASDDGQNWRELSRSTPAAPVGSPLRITTPVHTRHLRLRFPSPFTTPPALFEWRLLD